MRLRELRVQHFRSIHDDRLRCDDLTALVGANGTGKSSFLQALKLFYDPRATVELDDFYDRDTANNIRVTATFDNLGNATADLGRYPEGKTLMVTRVFAWRDGKVAARYHGTVGQNAALVEIRTVLGAGGRAREAKELHSALRATDEFGDLPAWTNVDTVKGDLDTWEKNNPHKCEPMEDDGGYFAFGGQASFDLGRHTRLLAIPAVRDAAEDATEGRASGITLLMDLVVRNALQAKEEVQGFISNWQNAYDELMTPEKHPQLGALETDLTNNLAMFIPNAKVNLGWAAAGPLELPMPQATIRLIEDGYATTVDRCGHGLQRAFVIALLQVLSQTQQTDSAIQSNDEQAVADPGLILAIEEPELFQHPSRQRYLAEILLKLSKGKLPGVGERTQIVYTTHSPLFVGIDRFDQLRILRKTNGPNGKPKVTTSRGVVLKDVVAALATAADEPHNTYTEEAFRPRLTAVMTPWMNEGFFAKVTVLVEGGSDRAAVLGWARGRGYDFDALGVSVIPCAGKTNIDKPAAIFQQFGIPTYLLWDSDSDKGDKDGHPEYNRLLLRLSGAEPEDWPRRLEGAFACFEVNLEATLREELGGTLYDDVLGAFQNAFRMEKRHAVKRDAFVIKLIEEAKQQGVSSPSLDAITDAILGLVPSEAPAS